MKTIDRRGFARVILFGVAGAGLGLVPGRATAMPLDGRVPGGFHDWIEKAQVWVAPPPRRRVWRCWWRKGRRVCGWRWV
jgi:hypothetical protein